MKKCETGEALDSLEEYGKQPWLLQHKETWVACVTVAKYMPVMGTFILCIHFYQMSCSRGNNNNNNNNGPFYTKDA